MNPRIPVRPWAVGLVFLLGAGCSELPREGVVLRDLKPWGAGARAGLEAGDVILSWSQDTGHPGTGESSDGVIDSPLRLLQMEIERSPLGPVTLTARRGRRRLEVLLDRGLWEMEGWPVLQGSGLEHAEEAERAATSEGPAAAATRWAELAEQARAAGRSLDAGWLLTRLGAALIDAGDLEGAATAFDSGRAALDDPSLLPVIYDLEGLSLEERGRYQEHLEAARESLRLREERASSPSAIAWSLFRVAGASYHNREIAGVEIAERAAAIYESLPSARVELARVSNLLGLFAYATGRLDEAESLQRRARELFQPMAPESRSMAAVLINLGLIAHERGRLSEAEAYYREAFEMQQRLGLEGNTIASTLNNLGLLAKDTGDLESARLYYEEALKIFIEERPGGIEEAGLENNLGILALRQGHLEAGEEHHRRALEIREERQPNGLDAASSLHNLGAVLRRRDRFEEARSYLVRAFEIKEELLPDTLVLSNTLFELGELVLAQAERSQAAAFHQRALAIRRSLAPDSSWTAESLFAVGNVAYESGRREEAERRWREAIDTLERQRGRLRLPPEGSSRFLAPFHSYHHRLAKLLFETGREREAFDLLESSRARALRVMMRDRVVPELELPPELSAERYRIEASLDRAESRLAGLSPQEADQVAAYRERIRELRLDLDDLQARIRRAVPRLADFQDPEPLGFEQVRSALDPGTLLLSYSVGSESTLLFVVAATGDPGPELEVHTLAVGEAELSRRVGNLRSFIERGRARPEIEAALVAQSARLFELLLSPADEALAPAERLLVVADGPLLTLPFGALVRRREPLEFLGPYKPLFLAPSGTVFAEVKASRPPPRPRSRFAALGRPSPATSGGGSHSRWAPLPHAEEEVQRIAALFDAGAEIYLGSEATEERAREAAANSDYLHFATHAYVHGRFPLDSALVLAPLQDGPASEGSGLLHAWEIIAAIRTEADLVTLSACDTALGGELAGEGLVGLARAFQYAGARSLLVSQWAVSDRTTAELMVRFYRHLLSGMSKSEALRSAQRELLSAPLTEGTERLDARHPFHWAAFQLLGDWQ